MVADMKLIEKAVGVLLFGAVWFVIFAMCIGAIR